MSKEKNDELTKSDDKSKIVRKGFKFTQSIPKKTKKVDGFRLQYNGLIAIDEYVKKEGINGLSDANMLSINSEVSVIELKYRGESKIIEASTKDGKISFREIDESEKLKITKGVKLKEVYPLGDKQYINYNVNTNSNEIESQYQNIIDSNIEKLGYEAYKISNSPLDRYPRLSENFKSELKEKNNIPPMPKRVAPPIPMPKRAAPPIPMPKRAAPLPPIPEMDDTASLKSYASDETLVNYKPEKEISKTNIPYVAEIKELQKSNNGVYKESDFSKNYFSKFLGKVKKNTDKISRALSNSQESLNSESVSKKIKTNSKNITKNNIKKQKSGGIEL